MKPKGHSVEVSRRAFIKSAASVGLVGLAGTSLVAPALARGRGDFRSVDLINNRTGDRLKSVYWMDGQYITEALDEISFLLRDWRQNLIMDYDRRAIDVLSAAQKRLESSEAIEVISGYRSPATNAWLRRKRRGVAKNSYHTKGMAIDITMKSRSVSQMYRAALACNGGGVGRYSRSQFVHVDCGPVRSWGR